MTCHLCHGHQRLDVLAGIITVIRQKHITFIYACMHTSTCAYLHYTLLHTCILTCVHTHLPASKQTHNINDKAWMHLEKTYLAWQPTPFYSVGIRAWSLWCSWTCLPHRATRCVGSPVQGTMTPSTLGHWFPKLFVEFHEPEPTKSCFALKSQVWLDVGHGTMGGRRYNWQKVNRSSFKMRNKMGFGNTRIGTRYGWVIPLWLMLFSYLVKNSLVALLEALCARNISLDPWISVFFWHFSFPFFCVCKVSNTAFLQPLSTRLLCLGVAIPLVCWLYMCAWVCVPLYVHVKMCT